MKHDLFADALSIIKNAENAGKRETVLPANKVIENFLKVMKDQGYIESFEFVDDKKAGRFNVGLSGKTNNCKAIKPRFSVKADEFEKWERRFLPAEGFGLLIVSTSQGIMTHKQAKEKNLGGRLLAFVY